MRHQSRSILASLMLLAFAGGASAANYTVENITVFTNTKASSAQDVLRQNAAYFGLPANLDNLTLVKVPRSSSRSARTANC